MPPTPETIDAAVHRERDRMVTTLRALADKIAAAPMDRAKDGLTWIAPVVEVLVNTVERALGRRC